LLVGLSTLPITGAPSTLGLFAGEMIKKDTLISVYSGHLMY